MSKEKVYTVSLGRVRYLINILPTKAVWNRVASEAWWPKAFHKAFKVFDYVPILKFQNKKDIG